MGKRLVIFRLRRNKVTWLLFLTWHKCITMVTGRRLRVVWLYSCIRRWQSVGLGRSLCKMRNTVTKMVSDRYKVAVKIKGIMKGRLYGMKRQRNGDTNLRSLMLDFYGKSK